MCTRKDRKSSVKKVQLRLVSEFEVLEDDMFFEEISSQEILESKESSCSDIFL